MIAYEGGRQGEKKGLPALLIHPPYPHVPFPSACVCRLCMYMYTYIHMCAMCRYAVCLF